MKENSEFIRIDAVQGSKELTPEPYASVRRQGSDADNKVQRDSNKFTAYIALGSNLGDRRKNIETAIEEIATFAEIKKTATIIETEPETDKTQPNFFNTVIEIHTDLKPIELLIRLHEIEHKMGRIRTPETKNAAREIDLDILLYGDEIINQPNLKIPHPRMHKRPFVTIPLAEIKP